VTRLLAVAALVLSAASCTKNYYAPTSPTAPDPTPPPAPVHTLEFRAESVLGFDTQTAQITYGTTVDGTNALSTTLPWVVTEPLPPGGNLFVYLQAVATGENQVRVQIVVDGRVFREATGFAPSISGTVR
jgi:hypothetical protein